MYVFTNMSVLERGETMFMCMCVCVKVACGALDPSAEQMAALPPAR